MDNFKVIYKILKYLETAMDFTELDTEPITAKALAISEERWLSIMTMLLENGYVKGIEIKSYTRSPAVMLHFENIKITLKGLEYLNENNIMKKIAKARMKKIAKAGMEIANLIK